MPIEERVGGIVDNHTRKNRGFVEPPGSPVHINVLEFLEVYSYYSVILETK